MRKSYLFTFILFATCLTFEAQGQAVEENSPSATTKSQAEEFVIEPIEATSAPVKAAPTIPTRKIPSLDRVDPVSWNARLGVGSALDPSVFWITFEAEAQLDKFIAIGPMVQFGLGDLTTYTMVSMGPRFTLPFYYFEWFFGASAGISYRDQTSAQFNNFMFEAHTGFEFYVLKYLSAGGALRMNWISSDAVERIPVFTGYISGHF